MNGMATPAIVILKVLGVVVGLIVLAGLFFNLLMLGMTFK